ncbi:extracellular solute-binding protein [Paenibacillus tarimensis]
MKKIELRALVRDYYVGALERAKSSFELLYPDIGVTFEVVGSDRFDAALDEHERNGTMPDVLELDETQLKHSLDRGIAADIGERLRQIPQLADDYYPAVLDAVRFGGAMAGLPMRPVNMVFFYNKGMFDEAGIAYPQDGWSWDQFMETALAMTKVKDDGSRQYGIFFPYEMENMEPFVLAAGGSLLSPDGKKTSGYMDSPETVRVIGQLADLSRVHKVAPPPGAAVSWDDMFMEGKFAMQYKGAWSLGQMLHKGIYDSYGAVQLPNFIDGTHGSYLCLLGYGMSARTAYPEQAWQFLRHLAIAESEESLGWQIGLPTRASIAARSGQAQDHLKAVFLREFGFVRRTAAFFHRDWRKLEAEIINPVVYEAIKGDGNIKDALTHAAEQVDRELNARL